MRDVRGRAGTQLSRHRTARRRGYFHRLAADYRAAHPSRSGDLHWIGESFRAWLAVRLAGTEYAWLLTSPRLEWSL